MELSQKEQWEEAKLIAYKLLEAYFGGPVPLDADGVEEMARELLRQNALFLEDLASDYINGAGQSRATAEGKLFIAI